MRIGSYSVVVTGADLQRLQEEVNEAFAKYEERIEALELLVIGDNVAEDPASDVQSDTETDTKTEEKDEESTTSTDTTAPKTPRKAKAAPKTAK